MNSEASRDSSLETAFRKLVQEIEQSYRPLPRQLRIRIEKWIEKLVATGSNAVWRKHRNAYARLLLDMIINKKLTEPFNVMPPDGPLPTFPTHVQAIKGNARDLLGPHEASFWRELYHKIDDVSEMNNKRGPRWFGEHPPLAALDHANFSREISNLNMLIKEQKIKIDLLEQQMHQERSKHELEIQRLHHLHRLELTRVMAKSNALLDRYSPPSSPSRTLARPSSSSEPRRGFESSFVSTTSNIHREPSSTSSSAPSRYRQQPVDSSNDEGTFNYSFTQTSRSHRQSKPRRFNNVESSFLANSVESVADILPFPVALSRQSASPASSFADATAGQQEVSFANYTALSDRHGSDSGSDSDIPRQRAASKPPSTNQSRRGSDASSADRRVQPPVPPPMSVMDSPESTGAGIAARPKQTSDDAFLAYLDGFQTRLSDVQEENQLARSTLLDVPLPQSPSALTAAEVSSTFLDPSHPQFSARTAYDHRQFPMSRTSDDPSIR